MISSEIWLSQPHLVVTTTTESAATSSLSTSPNAARRCQTAVAVPGSPTRTVLAAINGEASDTAKKIMISRHGSHWKARPCSFIGSQQAGHRGFIGSSKVLKLGWPDGAPSKLFFQPCVLLLKGFDDVLERRHIGRLGSGWQR